MKRFLVIANMNYYPSHGTSDWIGAFETREEAEKVIKEASKRRSSWHKYKFLTGAEADHVEVVDLQEWLSGNQYEDMVGEERKLQEELEKREMERMGYGRFYTSEN
jgi:hypothetical protein